MRDSAKHNHYHQPVSHPTRDIVSTNQILEDLLRLERSGDLLSELRIVFLQSNQAVYEHGDKIELVYFPLNSVVSDLGITADGTTLETSMVGCDGLVGISGILGSRHHQRWGWVTISGEAAQVDARIFDNLFSQNSAALKRFMSYYRSLVIQVSQRCICNTKHSVLQRLCCWLLMIHDRVDGNNLRLTQEMMASRIGARRAGITVAAGVLQESRAIEYRRGQLYILDRELLEELVCECYSNMKAVFRHPCETASKLV